MYNMNISLFGYKINVITLLFVIIFIVLISHTYCGCNDPYALIEGVETMGKDTQKSTDMSGNEVTAPIAKAKEGFAGANTNYGLSSPYNLNMDTPVDTSSWYQPNLVVKPGQPLNPAVKAFLDRPKQTLPLPEGEMNFFANTQFKPECCPNVYSNSQGCACMTGEQYNYLILRSGNNVPYSEY
jgi:hypothetical protein